MDISGSLSFCANAWWICMRISQNELLLRLQFVCSIFNIHTIPWKWYVMYKKQVHDTFNVCIFNHKMPVKWLKFIGFANKLQNVTLSASCTTPFVCFSSFHEFNTREYWKVLDFISFHDICVFLYILLTHFLNSFAFCINFQLQHNEHCEGGALGDRKKKTKSTR